MEHDAGLKNSEQLFIDFMYDFWHSVIYVKGLFGRLLNSWSARVINNSLKKPIIMSCVSVQD